MLDGALRRSGSPAVLALRLLVGAVLLGAVVFVPVARATDQFWLVQVASRMRDGDVLYRDIFYGAGPLGPFATWGVALVVGANVLALRLVTAAGALALTAVADRMARTCRAAVWLRALIAGALTVAQLPLVLNGSVRGVLSTAFALAAFAPLLTVATAEADGVAGDTAGSESGSGSIVSGDRLRRVAFLSGLAVGASFAVKQNIGAAAGFFALVRWVLTRGARTRTSVWPHYVAGAAAAIVTSLLPVLLTGGFGAMVRYGFSGKGRYLDSAGIPYPETVRAVFDDVVGGDAGAFGTPLLVVLPVLAVVVLAIVAVTDRTARPAMLVLAAVAATGVVMMYPRSDLAHVRSAAPAFIVAIGCGVALAARGSRVARVGNDLSTSGRVRLARILGVAVAIWIASTLVVEIRDRGLGWPDGALRDAADVVTEEEREDADELASRTDGNVLILRPDAALWYLISGAHNPTPYDYPLGSTFGNRGEDDVVAMIRRGEVDHVCAAPGRFRADGLRPERLLDYVEREMQPVAELGPCTLYRGRVPDPE